MSGLGDKGLNVVFVFVVLGLFNCVLHVCCSLTSLVILFCVVFPVFLFIISNLYMMHPEDRSWMWHSLETVKS